MQLDDEKVAIVTGASRGIGQGLVEAYRKHGYRVIANSRTITGSTHDEILTVAGGVADATLRVIAEMLAQGDGGHIVNITTTLVEALPSTLTALTKGGPRRRHPIHGPRVPATEFASTQSPGVIDTPLHAGVNASTGYAGMHPQTGSAPSPTSSTVCCTWRRHRSSRARSSTSTADSTPAIKSY